MKNYFMTQYIESHVTFFGKTLCHALFLCIFGCIQSPLSCCISWIHSLLLCVSISLSYKIHPSHPHPYTIFRNVAAMHFGFQRIFCLCGFSSFPFDLTTVEYSVKRKSRPIFIPMHSTQS